MVENIGIRNDYVYWGVMVGVVLLALFFLSLGYTAFSFIFGVSLGPSVAELHQDVRLASSAPLLALAAAAVAVPLWAWARAGNRRALIAGYALTPVAGAFAAGLGERASVQLLRHTYGYLAYKRTGGSLLFVQRQLGHAHPMVTAIYAQFVDESPTALAERGF